MSKNYMKYWFLLLGMMEDLFLLGITECGMPKL